MDKIIGVRLAGTAFYPNGEVTVSFFDTVTYLRWRRKSSA